MTTNETSPSLAKYPQLWAETGLFFLIIMESLVITAWYQVLAVPQRSWITGGCFVGLTYFLTYWIIRILRNIQIKTRLKNIIVIVWFLFVLMSTPLYNPGWEYIPIYLSISSKFVHPLCTMLPKMGILSV